MLFYILDLLTGGMSNVNRDSSSMNKYNADPGRYKVFDNPTERSKAARELKQRTDANRNRR